MVGVLSYNEPECGCADGHDGGNELVDLSEAGLLDAQPVHRDPVQGCVILRDKVHNGLGLS